ncbi:MAG: hypothetical protein VX403_00740, partial [Planctomycetota bacterium]|nr:hypothetical protein [Planctomycetota bacterium]
VAAEANKKAAEHRATGEALKIAQAGPSCAHEVQMDKAGILEIADLFVCNKADHAGEAKLVRELLDIAEGRPIHETVATLGKGVVELLDALLED